MRGALLSLIAVFLVAGIAFSEVTKLKGLENFVYPLVGTRTTSKFGKRKHPIVKVVRHHNGIDLAAPDGSLVRAVSSGVVTYADPYAKYGNLVVIAHDKKGVLTTHYGHLSEIRTVIGKKVKAGELIGAVGRTGGATGPHLHFEIRINGKPQDPGELLPMLSDAGAG